MLKYVKKSAESVEIIIDGFSGPLDLLCHLVENHKMQAAGIKMTQIVRIYGAYLSKTRKASVETLSEFFFMAATLLLQKTLALLPNENSGNLSLNLSLSEDEGFFEDGVLDNSTLENEMLERLARYKPYRAAAVWLEERKSIQDKHYRRVISEDNSKESGAEQNKESRLQEIYYDIGDLYFFCQVWWVLLEKLEKRSQQRDLSLQDDYNKDDNDDYYHDENYNKSYKNKNKWNGLPTALPEESQIQGRITELEEKLAIRTELSLNALWTIAPSIQTIVVTLLAVLEMCRMGKTIIEQDTLFSDVKIRARTKE